MAMRTDSDHERSASISAKLNPSLLLVSHVQLQMQDIL